jgi:hypothetical protein
LNLGDSLGKALALVKQVNFHSHRVDETSSAYFICLSKVHFMFLTSGIHLRHPVLDPNVRNLYCHHRWKQEQYDKGISSLEAVVRTILYIFR